MRHILVFILLCSHCYCQDSTNIYKNLDREERLLNQSGYNEDKIKEFKKQSPFHGNIGKESTVNNSSTEMVNIGGKQVPITKNGGYVDLRPLNNPTNYNSQTHTQSQEDYNPYAETLDSWEHVHYNDGTENNTPINSSYYHDNTDWTEIIITIGLIASALIACIFLYKLLK